MDYLIKNSLERISPEFYSVFAQPYRRNLDRQCRIAIMAISKLRYENFTFSDGIFFLEICPYFR